MSRREPAATLLDQNEALRDYLDALLSEVPAGDRPEPAREPARAPVPEQSVPGPRPGPVRPVPDAPGAPPTAREAPAEPGAAPEMPAEATPAPGRPATPPGPREAPPEAEAAPPAPETQAGSGDGNAAPGSGVPEWAVPDFQALLFHVGRMNLAVPLVKLHSVVPWDDGITAMPNQPEWCHGLPLSRTQRHGDRYRGSGAAGAQP